MSMCVTIEINYIISSIQINDKINYKKIVYDESYSCRRTFQLIASFSSIIIKVPFFFKYYNKS